MLQQVVDIKCWLAADRELDYSARLERDRQIGSEIEPEENFERVFAWWQKVEKDANSNLGERVVTIRGFASLCLFGIGVVLGLGIAGVAFAFNGFHPVNLFALFGVLVGLPLLFLIISLLVLLVPIPGVSKLVRHFSALNPGRWVSAWLDRSVELTLFFSTSGSPAALTFSRWQIIRFSQWFSVGYFFGVLGLAWLLVVFTDLAFGWSTTLHIEAASVQSWFISLAAPWRGWLPDAVPSLALVEASQFYRLEENVSLERVVQLGSWWPFVMMVILVYGLLPRVVFLLFAAWRSRIATKELLLNDPEVTALVDRLKQPTVSYDPSTSSATPNRNSQISEATPMNLPKISGHTSMLIWNQALSATAATRWFDDDVNLKTIEPISITLAQSVEQQATMLGRISEGIDTLIIFVKGWEPPTLDFQDLLLEVRARLNTDVTIMIVPVNIQLDGVNKPERDIWDVALGSRCPGSYVLGTFP